MAGKSGVDNEALNNGNGNGLLLYQYYRCGYCQKVSMALNEKNLKFKSHTVDIMSGKQFSPWFLKINPKAEVPVLKDGVKIIPDSQRIIDYLEDNFSNGDTPRLRPEKGGEQYKKMEQILMLLNKVQTSVLFYGCLLYPDLTTEIKYKSYEIKEALDKYSVCTRILNDYIEEHAEFRNIYEEKKHNLETLWTKVQVREEVEKELKGLEHILDEMEMELATHADKGWWLCAEKFTTADISLAVLLNRLHELGLWERYFGNGKRSLTDAYFRRLQNRESFKKTFNQNSGLLKSFCHGGVKDKMLFIVGGFVVFVGLVGLGTYIYHRKK